ncbi:hypothetical protein Pan258_46850 [Symmachiella dynata]|uniref:hypothetical protein n=1 Tax=Symmachiella dynata TaxID=2527995 RepID=UPI00118D16C6|nr:hypothetical protein [Symmachiella dynata]QDT50606.1 hypothetical protein Pan258_46850 [Symmachiella dynata]
MSKYHDDRTAASDPIGVYLSRQLLHEHFPRKSFWDHIQKLLGFAEKFEEMLDEHLSFGDSRAAVVVTPDPLLVAAYTDEFDCTAVLAFPDSIVAEFGPFKTGDRLLTVNTYRPGGPLVADLWNGERSYRRYANFFPVIVDFLSENKAQINRRKSAISEEEWERCLSQAQEYLDKNNGRFRNGSPLRSYRPA